MPFDLQAYLHERRALIDAELERRSVEPAGLGDDVPDSLREAIAYSLLAGGKRLRPILVLAGYEAVAPGGSADLAVAVPTACAVEMIHTYSLIHDDLPSLVNDDFRRGQPTLHKKVGEAMAILAGDALLTEAFRMVAGSPAPPAATVEVMLRLTQAVGAAGMVGGQVIDIESTGAGKKIDLAHLQRLHRKKTGALLSVSVWAGARLGGAAPGSDALDRLTRFADALGLAFQIIDDVLDVTADLATLGKDPGSDKAKGKTTYVDLLGIDGARRHAEEVMAAGLEAIAPLDASAEPLHALARYTIHRVN
jgi:geranylgeranyl diphosphate synthase, type II